MAADGSDSPVAIVTGSACGIGLTVAQWFLAHDYRVVLLDIDRETLEGANKVLADPRRVLALGCDVASQAEVATAIDRATTTFGRIDALINNAGVTVFKPAPKTTYDEWRFVMATNLDGVFICSQACVPQLRRSSGSIVNICPSRACAPARCASRTAPARQR